MNIDSAIFYTSDINKAKEFYLAILNFPLEYEQEWTYLSFILKNNVRLGIKKSHEKRELPGSQTVFIELTEIDEFYKLILKKKIIINKPLITESLRRNFSILDPDGNKIQFVKRNSK